MSFAGAALHRVRLRIFNSIGRLHCLSSGTWDFDFSEHVCTDYPVRGTTNIRLPVAGHSLTAKVASAGPALRLPAVSLSGLDGVKRHDAAGEPTVVGMDRATMSSRTVWGSLRRSP